jgi:hypothetical protein
MIKKIKKIIKNIKIFFLNYELFYNYNLYKEKRISSKEYLRRAKKIRSVYNI